jgi:hypothetical protein
VKEGEEFSLAPSLGKRNNNQRDPQDFPDVRVNYREGPIDMIILNYADFVALTVQDIVNSKNINHLHCIPTRLLNDIEQVFEVFYSIIKFNKCKWLTSEIKISEADVMFKHYVKKDLTQFFAYT